MNRLQTVNLCRLIASLCPSQKFDEYTPEAWFLVLDDVDYDQAVAAVRTVYRDLGNDQEWGSRKIEADDVLRQVRRTRNEIIAQRVGKYQPPSGLTPQEYSDWYRDLLKRLGDGEVPPTRAVEGSSRTIPVIGRRMDVA